MPSTVVFLLWYFVKVISPENLYKVCSAAVIRFKRDLRPLLQLQIKRFVEMNARV